MSETNERDLAQLLVTQTVAALATLHRGRPAVSMVPFAVLPETAGFVIHVSRLAAHTGDLVANPEVALLVTADAQPATPPMALPRVSISGWARRCAPESDDYEPARAAYLSKLPAAEELFAFADFSLFIIEAQSIRYVAGFGLATTLDAQRLRAALGTYAC